jgi:hypothetical protein
MERATGIEPTREAPPDLENEQFGAMTNPNCDWRVNFRGMWGHVWLRRDTSMCEVRGSSLPSSDVALIGLRRGLLCEDAVPGEVRKGTNGFICMAQPDPCCMDKNSMDWLDAWAAHKPPAEGKVGFMYMLKGGPASQSNPWDEKPSPQIIG